ncbi:MAG: outer membrane protein assembly factor BamD [Lutibacter sp.]|uniref:outer membrane protein assembly factor BamD n=1 Tax=Lutibacter sp. TaxID=1925666 RepID=UPI0017A0D5D8|nr:outer membrane protein assembly factor BamD [Lutibacter sp.]MBT8317121.1 outer membrane protein assembly factor BamD [Lutibacter sp.]NNJ57981.1 outer membrane protein assembly factor BamD [Lutibacter sp.]
MQKNKIYIFILLIAIGVSSCSEYQKVLNKGTVQDQYQMATKMYESQKYNKAIQLFEKITPSYRGKPQMERIQYMIAQAHYNTKQYTLAAYYFDKFVKNYPKSSKVEESAYLSAQSYYLASPIFSLDQKDSYEAITALQNFIYKYPNSPNIVDANKLIKELTHKLEKKSFEIAKQYYHTTDYIAAIVAFDNLLSDYLGTSYKEEALYYKFKSAYELAINSYIAKKEERLLNAIKIHERFKRSFPNSEYINETDKLSINLNEEYNSLTALKTETNGL